ncbi:MAG: tRNA (adenosine(37)-N6)-threonylcarbamoyltransferase complex dimerization subunit type 1 TsaB [Paracoccaceae bacterium]|nr:tRNA (adenosine(37)-N6)-threonylcarbamoyltransferase complex dimerization subunit type 1 TsaB [Paracoccaceae bacterium]
MPEALILAFDTSAAHCAAALLHGDTLIAACFEPMEKGQAERLMPLLQDLLAGAGLGWRDLSALAVGTGPGNFTGVRIAVSAARGLALALAVPCIGVTRFDALGHGLPRPLAVVEDARRGEAYAAQLAPPGQGIAPHLAPLSALAATLTAPMLIGTAAEALAALLPCPATVLPPACPLAEAIARVARTRLDRPHPRPAPFYLRAADAAPPSDPPPVILR